MKDAGWLEIRVDLTRPELERVADVLSAVASDIRKGEDKRGRLIDLLVEPSTVNCDGSID